MKLKCYKSLKYTVADKRESKIDSLWILVTFIINIFRHIANSRLSYMHMQYIYYIRSLPLLDINAFCKIMMSSSISYFMNILLPFTICVQVCVIVATVCCDIKT